MRKPTGSVYRHIFMNQSLHKKSIILVFTCSMLIPVVSVCATDVNSSSAEENQKRIDELEEKLQITTDILSDLNSRVEKGMDFAGYTDVEYITSNSKDINDSFRMHHFNMQFLKAFGDRWHFFSEIEFEDAPKYEAEGEEQPVTAEGDVVHEAKGTIFVEAVNFTYQRSQELNFRIGRTLTPAGIWNVDHYTPNVPTQERPQHITHDESIFPSSLDGVQLFGTLPIGNYFLNYDLYTGNGRGDNPGSSDDNGDKAIGARVSFLLPVLTHLELGASYYTDEGDNSHDGKVDLTSSGVHGKIIGGPVTLQFEYALGKSDSADSVEKAKGYYLQLLYDFEKYTFGGRHDFYNPHVNESDENRGTTVNSIFVNYHVNTHVTLKVEHHVFDHEDSQVDDYHKTIFSVVGYLGN